MRVRKFKKTSILLIIFSLLFNKASIAAFVEDDQTPTRTPPKQSALKRKEPKSRATRTPRFDPKPKEKRVEERKRIAAQRKEKFRDLLSQKRLAKKQKKEQKERTLQKQLLLKQEQRNKVRAERKHRLQQTKQEKTPIVQELKLTLQQQPPLQPVEEQKISMAPTPQQQPVLEKVEVERIPPQTHSVAPTEQPALQQVEEQKVSMPSTPQQQPILEKVEVERIPPQTHSVAPIEQPALQEEQALNVLPQEQVVIPQKRDIDSTVSTDNVPTSHAVSTPLPKEDAIPTLINTATSVQMETNIAHPMDEQNSSSQNEESGSTNQLIDRVERVEDVFQPQTIQSRAEKLSEKARPIVEQPFQEALSQQQHKPTVNVAEELETARLQKEEEDRQEQTRIDNELYLKQEKEKEDLRIAQEKTRQEEEARLQKEEEDLQEQTRIDNELYLKQEKEKEDLRIAQEKIRTDEETRLKKEREELEEQKHKEEEAIRLTQQKEEEEARQRKLEEDRMAMELHQKKEVEESHSKKEKEIGLNQLELEREKFKELEETTRNQPFSKKANAHIKKRQEKENAINHKMRELYLFLEKEQKKIQAAKLGEKTGDAIAQFKTNERSFYTSAVNYFAWLNGADAQQAKHLQTGTTDTQAMEKLFLGWLNSANPEVSTLLQSLSAKYLVESKNPVAKESLRKGLEVGIGIFAKDANYRWEKSPLLKEDGQKLLDDRDELVLKDIKFKKRFFDVDGKIKKKKVLKLLKDNKAPLPADYYTFYDESDSTHSHEVYRVILLGDANYTATLLLEPVSK